MGVRLGAMPRKMHILTGLEYLFVFCVLLYSTTWARFTSAGGNTFIRRGRPLLLGMVCLRMGVIPAHRWRRLAVLAVYLAVYLLATRFNGVRFVLYFFLPLCLLALYLGQVDDAQPGYGLLYKLGDIVCVLTAVSLLLFTFGTCLDVLPGESTASYFWGESQRTVTTYYHLYYEAQRIDFLGHTFIRNCGIFPEAPGFAIYLVYATAVEVLLRPHPRLWRCGLYILATATTFSAKAIILVAAVFALKYVLVPAAGWFSLRLKTLLVPAALVLVGLVGGVVMWDKMQSVSFFMRLDDVIACFKTWLTAPVFGTGYWNDASVIPHFAYPDRYNNGLSMGIMVTLAQGGVYLLALYIFPAVLWIKRTVREQRRMAAAFALIVFMLLFTSNLAYNFLTLFLLAVFLEYGRSLPKTHPDPQATFVRSQ